MSHTIRKPDDLPKNFFTIILTLEILLFLILVRTTLPTTIDDTFITLRYAEHTAHGFFSQWNLHEQPQEGYTHPLFFLIATLLFKLTPHPLLPLKIINITVFLFSLLTLPLLFRSLNTPAPRFTTILTLPVILYNPLTLIHASSGLETLFYTGLLILTTTLTLRTLQENTSRELLLLLLISTLFFLSLTRPEGILISLTILIILTIRKKWIIPLILYLSFLILLEGIRILLFRLPLPLPAYVKLITPHSLLMSILISIFQSGILLIFLVPIIIHLSRRRNISFMDPFIFLLIIISAQLFIYFFSERLMDYAFRFFYPAIVLLIITSMASLNHLITHISAQRSILILTTLSLTLLFWTIRAGEFFIYTPLAFTLLNAHGMLGAALYDINLSQPLTVMGGDAGIIPYVASNITFIDSIGLNTPFFIKDRHPLKEKLTHLLTNSTPDILILVSRQKEFFSPNGITDAYLYQLIQRSAYTDCNATFPLDARGTGTYILFTYTREESFCNTLQVYSKKSWERYASRYPDTQPLPSLKSHDLKETIHRLISLSPSYYTPYIPILKPELLREYALRD